MPVIDDLTLEATLVRHNRMVLLVATIVFPMILMPVVGAFAQASYYRSIMSVDRADVILTVGSGLVIGFAATPITINALARKRRWVALPAVAVSVMTLALATAALAGPFIAAIVMLAAMTIVPVTLWGILPDDLRSGKDRCPRCGQLCPPTGASICPECGFLFVMHTDETQATGAGAAATPDQ